MKLKGFLKNSLVKRGILIGVVVVSIVGIIGYTAVKGKDKVKEDTKVVDEAYNSIEAQPVDVKFLFTEKDDLIVTTLDGKNITLGDVKGTYAYNYYLSTLGYNDKEKTCDALNLYDLFVGVGREYSMEDIKAMKDEVKEELAQYMISTRIAGIDEILNNKLSLTLADKLGVKPSDEDLSAKVGKQLSERAADYPSIADYLKENNITEVQEKARIQAEILNDLVGVKLMEQENVSAKEVEEYYNKNKSIFLSSGKVNFNVIYFESKDEADKALKSFESGVSNFETYFNAHKGDSKDSKVFCAESGDIALSDESLDYNMASLVVSLGQGGISDVRPTEDGVFMIVKVNSLDDVNYSAYADVKDDLTSYMGYTLIQEYIDKNHKIEWGKDLGLVGGKTYDLEE